MKNHPPLRDGHQIKLLKGGAEFFPELIRTLDAARSQVQLETYIFDFHGNGALVAAALERAGRRGLRVWVVVDGVGTPRLPEEWRLRFDEAGVAWHVYSPLGALGLLIPNRWRRLHRKLCVIDGHVAFCGGINILDDWHDPKYGALKSPRLYFPLCPTGGLLQKVK
jgi:cardiolipin synthase